MIGTRLTDETGEFEVTGFDAGTGKFTLQRLDSFEVPHAVEPGEIARRFSVEVTAPDTSPDAQREADARGWELLAQQNADAQTMRPASAASPEETFAIHAAEAQRLGHRR